VGGKSYVAGGGTEPGLAPSTINEVYIP